MQLKKLKKEFGPAVQVERGPGVLLEGKNFVRVRAGGLEYRVDEGRFKDEKELADHLKSKLPFMNVRLHD